MAEHLLIKYSRLLTKHQSPQAKPVREFIRRHAKDATFVRRVRKLNELFVARRG